jgi:uncharacterized repeat protein (TIGR01451 family)
MPLQLLARGEWPARRLSTVLWMTFALLAAGLAGRAQAQTCGIAGNDAPATVSGIVNSYFPGALSAAAGSTSIMLGTRNAAGAALDFSAGDLVLVIQMQGADINSSDTDSYGDGVGGSGTPDSDVYGGANYAGGFLNNANFTAGRYEFAVATGGAGSGGMLTLARPLANSYVNGTRQTFQVVRVPQYPSATIGAAGLTAAPWNGASGGIVAIDVAGTLTLAGNINVNGLGFRGGGVINNAAQTAPQYAGYRNAYSTQNGAMKGEGIAGTPARTYSAAAGLSATAATDGYPGGDVGRGAPGNAGGGGNQHNCGGGGGANGGAGGRGGACWNGNNGNFDGPIRGGMGGSPPVAGSTPTRLFFGGGGGSGDVGGNTSTLPQGAGGAGGGIIVVRAGTITGSGTFSANGDPGVDIVSTDASGGGGAGGTILVQVQSGTIPATLTAAGGRGGNNQMGAAPATSPEQDGPGGGGGGGVIYTNTGASGTVTGGVNGCLTSGAVSPGDPPSGGCAAYYGRTGFAGINGTFSAPLANTGTYAGSACLPVLAVTKSTSTPSISAATGATATYAVTVQNTGGAARNVSVIDNPLPPGWTLTGTPTYNYSPPGPFAAGNLAAGAEAGGGTPPASFPLRTPSNAAPGTVPAVGSNGLTWGTFFLPQNGSVTIFYTVAIADSAAAGTYHNGAGVTFLDPTRNTASRTVGPAANNTAVRGGAAYAANTSYQTGGTVGGSHYSGLAGGPATDDVKLLADLSVTKTHTPASFAVGAAGQSYSIVVRNNGRPIRSLSFAADQATDATPQAIGGNPVTLSDTLPAGVTLAAAPSSSNAQWACTGAAGAGSFSCTQNNAAYPLAAATDLTTITVPVNVAATACPGPAANTAVVSAAPVGEANGANNSGTDNAPVNCVADLVLTKTDNKAATTPGAINTYTITLTNNGPSAADNAVLTDPAAAGLGCTAVSCAASGGAVCPAAGGGAGQLSVGNLQGAGVVVPTLPSGGVITLTLTCSVTATGN